jgi:septal ring factor EnvC (AmiA/AmiB activator)
MLERMQAELLRERADRRQVEELLRSSQLDCDLFMQQHEVHGRRVEDLERQISELESFRTGAEEVPKLRDTIARLETELATRANGRASDCDSHPKLSTRGTPSDDETGPNVPQQTQLDQLQAALREADAAMTHLRFGFDERLARAHAEANKTIGDMESQFNRERQKGEERERFLTLEVQRLRETDGRHSSECEQLLAENGELKRRLAIVSQRMLDTP